LSDVELRRNMIQKRQSMKFDTYFTCLITLLKSLQLISGKCGAVPEWRVINQEVVGSIPVYAGALDFFDWKIRRKNPVMPENSGVRKRPAPEISDGFRNSGADKEKIRCI